MGEPTPSCPLNALETGFEMLSPIVRTLGCWTMREPFLCHLSPLPICLSITKPLFSDRFQGVMRV